jgi:D-alanyl-D-alanine carboxypeptidase
MHKNTIKKFKIRPATLEDLATLPALSSKRNLILDRALFVAEEKDCLVCVAGLCLDQSELIWQRVDDTTSPDSVSTALIARVERMAIGFGLLDLRTTLAFSDAGLFEKLGYVAQPGKSRREGLLMTRSLRRRQTRYSRRILGIMQQLGIHGDYGQRHRLAMQQEARRLHNIGLDVFGRKQQLSPVAAHAWNQLLESAAKDDVEIQVVSAWRSVDYQQSLVQNKIIKGQKMGDILKVSAVPGYSEHHTGRALDVTAPGFAVLEEEFENSPAFSWLTDHAKEFRFRLSFPRGNRHLLAYEPWHWFYEG